MGHGQARRAARLGLAAAVAAAVAAAPAAAVAQAAAPPVVEAQATAAAEADGPERIAAAPRADLDLDAALAAGARPLAAADVVAAAVETAPDLARARAAVEVAGAGVRAATAAFVPRVDLSARYLRIGGFEDGVISLGDSAIPRDQALTLVESIADPATRVLLGAIVEQQSGTTEVVFATPRNQTAFRAALTVPLTDLFLTILPSYRAARERVEVEEERLAADTADVALAAEEAFFRYVQARGVVAVAESAVELAGEHRGRVAAVRRAGLATEADGLAADARVAASRAAVARARGGLALARTALATVMHREDDGAEFSISGGVTSELPAAPPAVTAERVERAVAQRPETAALAALVRAQDHAGRAARGGHVPRLLVVAGADVASPNPRVIPPDDDFVPSFEVGALVTWSPSDSLAADARSREARARRAQAEAELDRLRDAVGLQLRRAREDHLAALAVAAAAEERLAAARAAYVARAAELRAGEAVPTQLLDAEMELTLARLERLGAAVDAHVAAARFRRAAGE
jgi:outer membrane protein TolC